MKQFGLHPMQWRRISVPFRTKSKRDFLPWWVKRNCPALKAKPSNEELTILRGRCLKICFSRALLIIGFLNGSFSPPQINRQLPFSHHESCLINSYQEGPGKGWRELGD
jgi:hypothetical protein